MPTSLPNMTFRAKESPVASIPGATGDRSKSAPTEFSACDSDRQPEPENETRIIHRVRCCYCSRALPAAVAGNITALVPNPGMALIISQQHGRLFRERREEIKQWAPLPAATPSSAAAPISAGFSFSLPQPAELASCQRSLREHLQDRERRCWKSSRQSLRRREHQTTRRPPSAWHSVRCRRPIMLLSYRQQLHRRRLL